MDLYRLSENTAIELMPSTLLSAIASLVVLKETSSLVFNTSSLDIKSVVLKSDALQGELTPTSQSIDTKSERLTADFASALPTGAKATLKIDYSAKLTGNMMGYYYSTEEKGDKKVYYTLTQFEVSSTQAL